MGAQKPQEELITAIPYATAINSFKTIARKRRTLSKGKILIISRYEKKCFKQEQEGKKMISTAKAIKKTRRSTRNEHKKNLLKDAVIQSLILKHMNLGKKNQNTLIL